MPEENRKDDKVSNTEGQEDYQSEVNEEEAEMKERLVRMAADFDNYKKRVAKDMDNSMEKGRIDVITKLLPTVDEFGLALESFDKKDDHLKGMSLIYANMMSTLKGLGVREIEAEGKFDPYRHEIVLVQDSNKDEDDVIVRVVRKGYMLNTIMLRPASVIVAKKVPADQDKKENEKIGE